MNPLSNQDLPLWKLEQRMAKAYICFGRPLGSYGLNLGIKKFKRDNKGNSKAIREYKKYAWDAVRVRGI